MRTPSNTPYNFRQQVLLRNTSNSNHNLNMTSPTKTKQPLGERDSNLQSPPKSPSKVPLPPSPTKKSPEPATQHPSFTDETGPMDAMFNASTLSQKPQLVRNIAEAHSAGQTYVSPSDGILSPATKKLSEVKGKRFSKSTSLYKSQNIFAKTKTGTHEDTKG